MEVEYRIANRGGEYFPQVRYKKYLFWSSWKKIAKHISGYGIYTLPNWENHKSENECKNIIKGFHEWFKKENTVSVVYEKYTPFDY